VTTLVALARHVGTASLAGVIAGILVGGVLGRIVMRIAGFTAGPGLVGAFTANDNRVGEITFAGTVGLIVFVGIAAGLVGGMLYAALEPWLRRLRPWHGLAYGAGLLVTFGFLVIEPTNLDFRRFGSPALNVAMFAGLFLAFGVVVAWLFDRLRAIIAGHGRAARPVEIFAFLALAPGLVAAVLVAISVTGLAQPLFPIVFAAGLLIATIARWRRLPALIGYASFAVPVLIGAARTFGGLPELLTGL
jgi:hypothetical protein